MRISGNTMLITGGNSGIGRRLAEEFARRGNSVVITGRDQARIDAVTASNPNITGYVLDVQDGEAIRTFAARIIGERPELNIVINNAGIMVAEDPQRPDSRIAEAVVTTNLLGPIRLISALMPHMLKQPDAAIITVSSGLAFVPLAATPTYNATKAAIHSYSISLREQLKDTGVEVIEIVPPGVRTDLMPGQADNPQLMPLEDYIAETMALFEQQPTPIENAVERVKFLYKATEQGRFAETFRTLNDTHA